VLPKLVSSSDETSPETRLGDCGTENKVKILMAVGPASAPLAAPRKKRVWTKLTAEQKERMLEFAQRFRWRVHKAGAEAVDAFCAQIGVTQRVFKNWINNNRHLAKIPPSALPSHHQDHPAATAQGSMTEEGKSLEAEVDVSADGGKDGENEVSDPI
jgi:ZF-HD class homeobox domain-containing protein